MTAVVSSLRQRQLGRLLGCGWIKKALFIGPLPLCTHHCVYVCVCVRASVLACVSVCACVCVCVRLQSEVSETGSLLEDRNHSDHTQGLFRHHKGEPEHRLTHSLCICYQCDFFIHSVSFYINLKDKTGFIFLTVDMFTILGFKVFFVLFLYSNPFTNSQPFFFDLTTVCSLTKMFCSCDVFSHGARTGMCAF